MYWGRTLQISRKRRLYTSWEMGDGESLQPRFLLIGPGPATNWTLRDRRTAKEER